MALGRDEVVSLSGAGEIVIDMLAEAVPADVSVAVAVKVKAAALDGVPEIVPDVESESPSGREPLVRAHEYGGAPPLAVSAAE
jgi:hypothetical protein